MLRKQTMMQEAVDYFFLKSKDVHQEDNTTTITLFGRLSREITYFDGVNSFNKVDTFWVDIDELAFEQATEKIKNLPNEICRYAITEQVFRELFMLSKDSPKELYFITPLYIKKC